MPALHLTESEAAMLRGEEGQAVALAMRIIVAMAEMQHAARLLPITRAHIDGCLYHGAAGLDFAVRLAELGGTVRVPTSLNVASLDLLHPQLYRGKPEEASAARSLMDAYVAMGCSPTWTCAPYQLEDRPGFGEQIAWAESNAIVFANSVLGARTNRYGDFVDICAALTGRVAATGLHLNEGRRARVVYDVTSIRPALLREAAGMAALGHLIGEDALSAVVAVVGVGQASEDHIKALGAAAASSGAVALIHVVGITPEAPNIAAATHGGPPDRTVAVTEAMMRAARNELTTASSSALDAVSLGTPHASAAELDLIAATLGERRVAGGVVCYVSTGRDVLATAAPAVQRLEAAGVQIVTDTCTYITPILDPSTRVVMTDSAKWAYYAPGNIGVSTIFGTTAECVESAVAGRVVRDREVWGG